MKKAISILLSLALAVGLLTGCSAASTPDSGSKKDVYKRQVQGKALRIKINNANLQWDHYAINEVLVKDSSVSPVNANIASETTSEWDSENGGLLTDGDLTEAAQSDNRPSLPMDIVLKLSLIHI